VRSRIRWIVKQPSLGRGRLKGTTVYRQAFLRSIKVGGKDANSTTQDVIVVRGVSADVDRAVKGILKIVQDAKNDEIVNSHVS
jgi:hypothetical protein